MANTIAAQMSTLITLDNSKVTQSLRTIKNMARAASTEARANAEALRAVGNSMHAAKSEYDGYRTQLDLARQRVKMLTDQHKALADMLSDKSGNLKSLSSKIDDLTAKRDEARQQLKDLKNDEDAEASAVNKAQQAYKDLQKQLQETKREYNDLANGRVNEKFARQSQQLAAAQLDQAKLEKQTSAAQDAYVKQLTGLKNLQNQYSQTQNSAKAYIDRLNAEGKSASATVQNYNSHKQALTNLHNQYEAQSAVLDNVREKYGENSSQYAKEKVQLDQIATTMANTKRETLALSGTVARIRPTGITNIDNALTGLRDKTGRIHDYMAAKFDSIKQHAVGIGIGVGIAGSQLVQGAKEAGDLQNSYMQTQNLLITGGEKHAEALRNVRQMQQQGRDMSIEYGQSQQSIAEAYQELTKRGYSSAQSLGAMKTMLQASVATGEPLSDIVNSSASALEAFGMKAKTTAGMVKNTKDVVNKMAYAADMTSTNFNDMSTAMSYVGPSARNLGLNVGETASAIGVLSNNGIEADKAGTGLRKVLDSIATPTSSGRAALQKLGLTVDDFKDKSGHMKSVADIFELLNEKTKGLSQTAKAGIFKDLFGATGEAAGITLANNAKQLDQVNKKTQSAAKGTGYVQKLAKKNMGSAKMATAQFRESLKAVRMELGASVMPAIAKATSSLAKFLNTKNGKRDMAALASTLKKVANAIVNVGTFAAKHGRTLKIFGVALGGAFAVTKVLSFAAHLKQVFQILGLVTNGMKILRIALIGSGIGLAVAAVAALAVGFTHLYTHSAKFRNFIRGVGKLVVAAFKLTLKYSPAGILARTFIALYKHNAKFRNFINSIVNITKKAFKAVADFFKKWIMDPIKNSLKWAYNKIADIGKGSIKHPSKAYASGTTGANGDQIAVVNDGNSQHWREMMLYNGRLSWFPNKRNMRAYIPAGAQVVNGDDAANLMSRSVNHFAAGTADFSSWVNNLNAAGAIEHAEERKKFMEELRKQFNQYMKEIKKTLLDLTKQLAQAEKQREDSMKQARRTLSDSSVQAYQKIASGHTLKEKQEGEKEKIIAYKQYWSAVNKANATYQAAADKIQKKRDLAYTNKRRLSLWYHDNIRQADAAFAKYAMGGIADRPAIFGDAGLEAAIPMDSMKQGAAWSLMQKVVDYYAGNQSNTSQPSQSSSADHEVLMQLNNQVAQLVNIATQLLGGQSAQIDATQKINGYNSDQAFNDFSSKFRTAQTSSLTW